MDLSPTQLQFLGKLRPVENAWKPKREVKVVLITLPSPWLISDRDMPNLGVLYVAAYLRENGVNVQVVDFCGVDQKYWFIPEGDIYGISCTTPQYPFAKYVCQKIKARQTGAYVVMGGYHPSAMPDFTLEDSGCDSVVIGDGEKSMLAIAKGFRSPKIDGERTDEIDTLPWPLRDAIDIRSYQLAGTNAVVGKSVDGTGRFLEEYVLQSRGCPFSCCLIAGTLIATEEGKSIPIEMIKPGQKVLTREGSKVVLKAWEAKRVRKVISVLFSSGSIVTGTHDHKVWTENRGWIELAKLQITDTVLCCWETAMSWDGKSPMSWPITFVEREFQEDVPVYDLEVEDCPEFFASGILVHNSYCAQMLISGRRVRYRSPDCVREEMTFLLERYGVNRFYLFDDLFVIDKKRVEAFCDMVDSMWRDGYKFDWHCLARADVGSLELYKRMVASHCKQITYGLEHADNEILKRNLKECTAEQNMAAVRAAKEAGLRVRAQFIVGLPGENEDSVKNLGEFIKNCPADSMAAHCFVPLPGSPVYTHPDRFQWEWNRGTDFEHYATIGKPGEWRAHQIHLNSDDILRWLIYIKAVIADRNVFHHDARHGAVIEPENVPAC